MNKRNPQSEDLMHDEPTPLDAFEREWADLLSEPDPQFLRSENAFVESVMRRYSSQATTPTVIGKIGPSTLRYAMAAGLMLAVLAAWYVMQAGTTGGSAIAPGEVAVNDPQPEPNVQVAHNEIRKVKIGELITQAQAVTRPATRLTLTDLNEIEPPRAKELLELINSPVPDFKELLAPLQANSPQSRA